MSMTIINVLEMSQAAALSRPSGMTVSEQSYYIFQNIIDTGLIAAAADR